jgi:hypothetical protein
MSRLFIPDMHRVDRNQHTGAVIEALINLGTVAYLPVRLPRMKGAWDRMAQSVPDVGRLK